MMGYRQKKETNTDDFDDEIGMKMSVVGRKMTESITKKGTRNLLFSFILLNISSTDQAFFKLS